LHFVATLLVGLIIGIAAEFALLVFVRERYQFRLLELNLERSKTEAILESVDDGLIVLDLAGSIVHINEVACAILELEAQTAKGDLHRLAANNRHVEKLLTARANPGDPDLGAPAEFRVFVRGRDHYYVSRELPWTGPTKSSLGTILVLQDVTYIRDQERQRTNLIATLSHELKTPLTSLAIGSELLTEASNLKRESPRQREILDIIHNDIERLKVIADTLLDASRTSTARIGVARRAIMLDRIVRDVCRTFALQADEKVVGIQVLGEERPIPIWGDPIKLPWVIINLVGNALRYTPRGGQISVEMRCEGTVARVTVTDTGPGIEPSVMPRIFEPYAQFGDDSAQVGSAGLGLHIAKEIIEAHNGRIFASSEAGHGATFAVEIPIREEALG
jgi:two-component system, NtrC family, sensor histidine kinase KinB